MDQVAAGDICSNLQQTVCLFCPFPFLPSSSLPLLFVFLFSLLLFLLLSFQPFFYPFKFKTFQFYFPIKTVILWHLHLFTYYR